MKRNILLSLWSTLLVVNTSFAYNRENDERIFNERQKSMEAQVVLGFMDFITAIALLNGAETAGKTTAMKLLEEEIAQAKKELRSAEKLLTHNEQTALIEKNLSDIETIERELTEEEFDQEGRSQRREKIRKLKHAVIDANNNPILTVEEKELRVANAKETLNQAKVNLLDEVDNHHFQRFGRRILSKVMISAGVVQILSLAGRVYVWNTYDTNPTFSPPLTLAWKLSQKIFE